LIKKISKITGKAIFLTWKILNKWYGASYQQSTRVGGTSLRLAMVIECSDKVCYQNSIKEI